MLTSTDLDHLRRCVQLARQAIAGGSPPFGSLLVGADGTVLTEDYNRIATAALEEKKFKALDKWMTENIASQYIMLDTEEAACPQLKKWAQAGKM